MAIRFIKTSECTYAQFCIYKKHVSFPICFQTFSFVIDISPIMVFCLYLSTFLPFSRIFLSHSKSLSCHSPLIHNLYRKSDTGMPLCTLSFKRKSNKESKPIMRILSFTSRVRQSQENVWNEMTN